MLRQTPTVPEEDALLCEGCGYMLRGLSPDGRCPECGKPIDESAENDGRQLPAWEQDPGFGSFLRTSAVVIFHPRRFFRTLRTRQRSRLAASFAAIHWTISAILLGITTHLFGDWTFGNLTARLLGNDDLFRVICLRVLFSLAVLAFFWSITALATRLSAWEAAYRGLRLPRAVILRALHYHAAHLLPVAILAFLTVWAYPHLIGRFPRPDVVIEYYAYVLCGEVVLCAFYLFKTYWTAMRAIMYANR